MASRRTRAGTPRLRPSFETPASRAPQDEVGVWFPSSMDLPGHSCVFERNLMESDMRLAVMAAASLGAAVLAASVVDAQVQNTTTLNPRDLRPVASFGGIADKTERSRALFNEVAKVITSPRCMNCHPAGDR